MTFEQEKETYYIHTDNTEPNYEIKLNTTEENKNAIWVTL